MQATAAPLQMDAPYIFHVRQQHYQPTFHGPVRQFGSGAMGAFAMRMGRVAMPLIKMYVLTVAKQFGNGLVSSFVPQIANNISGKKRSRKDVGDVLKQSANKTIAKVTETRSAAAGAGAVATAVGGGSRGLAKCRECAGDRETRARKSVKDGNKSSAGIPLVEKIVILKQSPIQGSRSNFLFKSSFS